MVELSARLDQLRSHLSDESFLRGKGLSNEVSIYIFAYHPADAIQVRFFVREVCTQQPGCHIIHYDLYDILMDICRERRILDRIPQMEAQKGHNFIVSQIQRIAPPEAYVEHMKYAPHQPGDVVFITGVGRVYPYMRSHNILNNLQHIFDDIPVVLFYPGEYTGQSLHLFEKFLDDNYYRAFNLI